MAISSLYYLDAPSLGAAVTVYTDAELTTPAPDGYYSDSTISRQQISGVLQPQEICTGCSDTYSINVWAHPSEPTIDTANVYYSINAGPDIMLGSVGTNLCHLVGTISGIPSGSVLHLGVLNGSVDCVEFDIAETTTTCPTGYTAFCGTVNTCTGYTTLAPILASFDVAITANCTGGTYVTCLP